MAKEYMIPDAAKPSESLIPAKPVAPAHHARWPATLAFIAIGGMYLVISPARSIVPNWLPLAVIIGMIILIRTALYRQRYRLNELLAISAATIVTISLVVSVFLLVISLPTHQTGAIALLGDAIAIWVTKVLVFSLWYWMLDGGGPGRRHPTQHVTGDFLFPQANLNSTKKWVPGFVDYLFLSFNTSTAFSPTDTAPLTPRAKLFMMVQSSLSLMTLAVLAARAINIF